MTLLIHFFALELLELFCNFTDSPWWISHQPSSGGYFNISLSGSMKCRSSEVLHASALEIGLSHLSGVRVDLLLCIGKMVMVRFPLGCSSLVQMEHCSHQRVQVSLFTSLVCLLHLFASVVRERTRTKWYTHSCSFFNKDALLNWSWTKLQGPAEAVLISVWCAEPSEKSRALGRRSPIPIVLLEDRSVVVAQTHKDGCCQEKSKGHRFLLQAR